MMKLTPFKIAHLFTPADALMNQPSFAKKLILLGTITLIAVSVGCFNLYVHKGDTIGSSHKEPCLFTNTPDGQADKTVKPRCTGSIGGIVFNSSEGSQEDRMKLADLAIYEAKDAGRNQIRFYEASQYV